MSSDKRPAAANDRGEGAELSLPITGISHVDLSVSDLAVSARWYVELLGFEVVDRHYNERAGFPWLHLLHRRSGVSLALIEHPDNGGEPFDEIACGLDHLSFGVGSRSDLETWRNLALERGYELAPIVNSGDSTVLVLRDPDNIQIELCVMPPAE